MENLKNIIKEEAENFFPLATNVSLVTEAGETTLIQKGESGDCYKNVQDYLLDNDIPNAFIIHGVVTSRNGTLDHAWIETDNEVYDPTTGIKTSKELYYSKLNPKIQAKYGFEEAINKRFSTGHYGPWTEGVISEVGEASASPYNWRMEISENMDGEIYRYEYYFTTEDNDKYTVEILSVDEYENEENAWALSFDAYEYGHSQVVNKGRLYRVMSTVLNVIKDFMKREDPYELVFEPTKKEEELDDEGNKRLALYMQYIKKNMPINYYVTVGGTKDLPEVIIRKKAKLGAKNPVNEVGEGTAKPYRIYEEYIDILYYGHAIFHFITEDNRKHTVRFDSSKLIEYDEWTVTFKQSSGGIQYKKPEPFTGGTNVYRIFATYLEIIDYFIALQDPDILAFLNFGEQKYNIFMQYLKKNLPMDYEISDNDKYDFLLVRKDFEEKTDELLYEKIIDEEISKFNKTIFKEVPDEIFQQVKLRKFSDEANRQHMKIFTAKDGKDYLVKKEINHDIFRAYDLNSKSNVAIAAFDVHPDYFSGYEVSQSIKVYPPYTRLGIATAITDFAENFYNLPYKPTKVLSADMQGFVKNRFKDDVNEALWNPDYKNSVMTDNQIIGKKVGDVFKGYDGIESIANKTIAYAKFIAGQPNYDFDALNNAMDFLEDEGYISGRLMEIGNYPVPFVKLGKLPKEEFELTGKMVDTIPIKGGETMIFPEVEWNMLDMNGINLLDGVLLSDDYNTKEIYVIFFNFPMNEAKKKKPKTMALPIGKIFSVGGVVEENELPKSHIMTREEFSKIVQEEIKKLNESSQVLTIRDLAELGTRMGYDYETFLEVYQNAFRRGGDEEVVKVAESMLKQKVYVLSKGRYTLSPVIGDEY